MSLYLALGTPEEREYAADYARWLRLCAAEMRENDPRRADDLEGDAAELEESIRAKEGTLGSEPG